MAENDLNVGDGASSEPQEKVSKPIDERTIQLLSELGGKVERFEKELHGLQSRQDKETNVFKEKMAEYDRLVKKGLEPDEAIAELDKRDKESTVLQDLQKKVAYLAERLEGQGRPESVSQEVVQAFEELGLDTKDPRAILAMQGTTSVEDAVVKAYKLKKQLSSAPSPTPAQSPAKTGPAPVHDVDSMTREYQQKMIAASGNPSAVKSLKEEYKKKGVPVDAVVFH